MRQEGDYIPAIVGCYIRMLGMMGLIETSF